MPLHRTRENEALQVAALLDQTGQSVVLRDACDILLDDRTFVQLCSDIVAACADEFYAAREGCVIWPGSSERGQKRVVDIDDPLRIRVDKLRRDDLHVAR